MHELQLKFAQAASEGAWEDALRAHFEANELDAVHAILRPALAALDSDFGRLCLETGPESVIIAGWGELVEAISTHEGEPITGVTLAVANEADRAFDKGQVHRPFMMLGLYCDGPFRFTRSTAGELLDQIQREEGPAWAGHDEDIEVFLEIEGLDRINTALIHHKQRHFFRDDAPDHAPLRYVEYVLGCWWRALLFQLAVASECAIHGLPGGIPVIAGMVDMRPEVTMVHGIGADSVGRERNTELRPAAAILAADFIQIRPVEEEKELTGADLRRKVAETGQEDEPVRGGFIARLFGR